MMNLLRKRHDGPYARKSSSNSIRYAPRIFVHRFLPRHILATAPISRTDS
jgi:hypothetical protein